MRKTRDAGTGPQEALAAGSAGGIPTPAKTPLAVSVRTLHYLPGGTHIYISVQSHTQGHRVCDPTQVKHPDQASPHRQDADRGLGRWRGQPAGFTGRFPSRVMEMFGT